MTFTAPKIDPNGSAAGTREPVLPRPRGELSDWVITHLRQAPHPLPAPPPIRDSWDGDDLQLALYVCYELHYRSFEGVDARWEWHPDLLSFRAPLEATFEAGIRAAVGAVVIQGSLEEQLWSITSGTGWGRSSTPSLSAFMAETGTLEQFREFTVHRSAYQLKEADPHTWAIPRLAGRPKAAMVEIQYDEYGCGVESEMHCSLFAVTMEELGLDSRYGAYLDWLPGSTLATVNLVSMLGLHRRLRAALVGHLAIFEMTSIVPMGRYASALTRLGLGPRARRFYDVHVEADAHHQTVAARDLAGRLAVDDPDLTTEILFGAHAVMEVERRFSQHILGRWATGRSSLRHPVIVS